MTIQNYITGIKKCMFSNREITHDVTSNWHLVKMKLLLSVFSCLYNMVKIFLFAVNSRGHFFLFLCDLFKVPLTPNFFISHQKSPFCSDHIGEKIIVVRFFLDFL